MVLFSIPCLICCMFFGMIGMMYVLNENANIAELLALHLNGPFIFICCGLSIVFMSALILFLIGEYHSGVKRDDLDKARQAYYDATETLRKQSDKFFYSVLNKELP